MPVSPAATSDESLSLAAPRNLAEIAAVVRSLPVPQVDAPSRARAFAIKAGLDPFPSEVLVWLAAGQNRFPPRLEHPRIALFVADHAGAGEGRSAREIAAPILSGDADLCALAGEMDADLRLYELNVDQPVADSRLGPAMEEGDCVAAILCGMMAVDSGLDALVLAGAGQGAETAAGFVAAALGHDALAALWLEHAPHGSADFARAADWPRHDPLALLRQVGGRDMAALLGAMLAARMAHTPVLAEGPSALAAAMLLDRLSRGGAGHVLYAGRDCHGEELRLAASLGLIQVATERGGPGEPAAALLPLLKAACAASGP